MSDWEHAKLLVLPGDFYRGDPPVSFAELADPAVAYHRCGAATRAFLRFLGRGWEISVLDHHTVHDGSLWAHAAAYVDGLVVDWTAAQFADPRWGMWHEPPADHPWVTTPDEWAARVRLR